MGHWLSWQVLMAVTNSPAVRSCVVANFPAISANRIVRRYFKVGVFQYLCHLRFAIKQFVSCALFFNYRRETFFDVSEE